MQTKKVTDKLDWAGSQLENRLMLAPMAGPGALPFRQICESFGASLTVGELCNARGILYDREFKRNDRYLSIDGLAKPAVIQLFGSDPVDFAKAIHRLMTIPDYQDCASIDINMGCPVAKVVKTGAGSALMRDPLLAAQIVESAAEAGHKYNKQISVKFRSGWDDQHIIAPEFASLMERAGANALCLHARTRDQMYSGKANWEIIGETAARVQVPFAANGDIDSLDACHTLLNKYGADACMIGRASLGQPWLFQEILVQAAGGDYLTPRGQDWANILLKHFRGLCELRGNEQAVKEFRTSFAYYVRGFAQAAKFRSALMVLTKLDEVEAMIKEVSLIL